MRTAWMNRYRGLGGEETFRTAAAWPREHKYGGEIFNVDSFRGRYFGYARPPFAIKSSKKSAPTIRIERLGVARTAEVVDNVLIIWTAPHPRRGVVIVGWYKYANVFRREQAPPAGSRRVYSGHPLGYYATTRVEHGMLLKPDMRTFSVPHMGQSLIWYAEGPRHQAFVRKVLAYVQARGIHPARVQARPPRNQNLFQRLAIERAAIKKVIKYFEGAGYSIRTVERDRIGWDLEARGIGELLRLEVKGRAGSDVLGELSPNELGQLREYQSTYRICIVTNALTRPSLHVFVYSPAARKWTDPNGRYLLITERIGAIVALAQQ